MVKPLLNSNGPCAAEFFVVSVCFVKPSIFVGGFSNPNLKKFRFAKQETHL